MQLLDTEEDFHDEEEFEERDSRYDRFESERRPMNQKREFASSPTNSKVADLLTKQTNPAIPPKKATGSGSTQLFSASEAEKASANEKGPTKLFAPQKIFINKHFKGAIEKQDNLKLSWDRSMPRQHEAGMLASKTGLLPMPMPRVSLGVMGTFPPPAFGAFPPMIRNPTAATMAPGVPRMNLAPNVRFSIPPPSMQVAPPPAPRNPRQFSHPQVRKQQPLLPRPGAPPFPGAPVGHVPPRFPGAPTASRMGPPASRIPAPFNASIPPPNFNRFPSELSRSPAKKIADKPITGEDRVWLEQTEKFLQKTLAPGSGSGGGGGGGGSERRHHYSYSSSDDESSEKEQAQNVRHGRRAHDAAESIRRKYNLPSRRNLASKSSGNGSGMTIDYNHGKEDQRSNSGGKGGSIMNEVGVDEEYLKRMEQQRKKREEILRIKNAKRKLEQMVKKCFIFLPIFA